MLLDTRDPSYWLAKVIAAPQRSAYSCAAIRGIVVTSSEFASKVNALVQEAYNTNSNILFHQDELDRFVWPMIQKVSQYNTKYAKLMQACSSQTAAPELKEDTIEVMQHCIAAVNGIQNVRGRTTLVEKLLGIVGWAFAQLYPHISGAIDFTKYVFYGVVAFVGIWAYAQLK